METLEIQYLTWKIQSLEREHSILKKLKKHTHYFTNNIIIKGPIFCSQYDCI